MPLLLTGPLDAAQRILAIVAGLLMIAMALQFFGLVLRFPSRRGRLRRQYSRHVVAQPAGDPQPRRAPIAFGVLNGFLPCPLVYAFAAQAASTAAPLSGLSGHAGLRSRAPSRRC